MDFLTNVLSKLNGKMERPTNYGWFHLMFVAIIVVLTIIVCVTIARKKNEKALKIVTFICWFTMLILEVYKQLNFSYNVATDSWDYQWYAFPYQLCSSPLYVLPFILILKDCKVRDNLMMYISTFAFFGGLVVFIYPNDVFVETIGINIQTMVHHGFQILLGIYYIVHNRDKISFKNFFKYGGAIGVFVILLAVAMGLNWAIPKYVTTETFNMFYISPYFDCTLPILSEIYKQVPYIAFLAIYIVGFVLAAFIVYMIYLILHKIFHRRNNDIQQN